MRNICHLRIWNITQKTQFVVLNESESLLCTERIGSIVAFSRNCRFNLNYLKQHGRHIYHKLIVSGIPFLRLEL